MPDSIGAAVVLALAILPGAFGAYVWEAVVGEDWREKDWQAALRYLAFSMLGLALYVLLAIPGDFLPPAHIVPATYTETKLQAGRLAPIVLPYFGHIVCAGIVSAVLAVVHRLGCKWTGSTLQPSSWNQFIQEELPKRWVVVSLKSGDVYAGYVKTIESGVAATERDMVLLFPSKFDAVSEKYTVTSYKSLFFPAELVQSIGAVRTEDELKLSPVVGQSLFPLAANDDEQARAGAAGTGQVG